MSLIRDGFASTGYEPVAETFFGYRAFRITSEGRAPTGRISPALLKRNNEADWTRGALRGVFKTAYQWGAGKNMAMCLRPGAAEHKMVQGSPHSLMLPACDCGFWAYTNGEHLLNLSGPGCLGIIEGWGRMVLGPHGFRAEKARVVALAFPRTDEDAAAARIDDAGASSRDDLRHALLKLAEAFTTLVATKLGAKPPTVTASALVSSQSTPRPWQLVTDQVRADVQRCYPEARLFESVAAMQREFPLSDLRGLLDAPDDDGDVDVQEAS